MKPGSPRRFRLPEFQWEPDPDRDDRWWTRDTPASAGWKLSVWKDRADDGVDEFYADVERNDESAFGNWAWRESHDEAKAWCEAEVARVAASMMVEVEDDEPYVTREEEERDMAEHQRLIDENYR